MKLQPVIDQKLRTLFKYNKTTNISAEDLKRVDVLNVENTSISTLQDLANMPNLKALNISGTKIKDIDVLVHTSIESLAMLQCEIRDLSVLEALPNLKELYIDQPLKKESLKIISQCITLETLVVYPIQKDLSFLSSLLNLKKCYLLNKEVDFLGIQSLTNLEHLEVEAKTFHNLSYLNYLQNLKQFIAINLSKKDRIILEEKGINIALVDTEDTFTPGFVTSLTNFHLDNGLKSDASDMFKAFFIIAFLIMIVFMVVGGINQGGKGVIDGLMYGLFLTGFFSLIAFSQYVHSFWIELEEHSIIFQKIYQKHPKEIAYKDIESVMFKHHYINQSKMILNTKEKTIRFSFSTFVNTKHLKILIKHLKEQSIHVEEKFD